MSFTDKEILEHKQLIEKVNELSQEKRDIINTGKMKREQALEILAKYGYEELKDVPKLQKTLDELEEKIREERKEIEAEIVSINELKERVENISVM